MFISRIPLLGIPGILAVYYVGVGYIFWGIKGRDVLNIAFITNHRFLYILCIISFLIGAGAFLFGMFSWFITKGYPEEHPTVRKAAGLRSMDYYISIITFAGFVIWLAGGIFAIFVNGITDFLGG